MKSIRLSFLLIVMGIISCHTDDDAPQVETAIVTIDVHATYLEADRQWAFVTNSHRDVISSQNDSSLYKEVSLEGFSKLTKNWSCPGLIKKKVTFICQ